MTFNIKRDTNVDILIKKLSEMILNEEFTDNKLPSEDELANIFNVSKTSIREAKGALSLIGAIEVYPGRGTIISDNAKDVLLFKQDIFSGKKPITLSEIMETRRILEPELVSLAAERYDEFDIEMIFKALKDMEKSSNINNFLKYDLIFHLSIAKASKNNFLYGIYKGMRKLLGEVLREVLSIEEIKEETLKIHYNIFKAIKERDSKKAYLESKNHIKFVINNLK